MKNTLRQWGLVIILLNVLLMGCGAIHEAALKLAEMSAPRENRETKQITTPEENKDAKQTATREIPSKEDDVNFIPTPRLSIQNFNHLWTVATNKCYDFGWSISNNDKTTRNLICQTQSSGSTITLRVKFADEGIYIDLQMSTLGWALFGKGMASKATEHREMKKALQEALSEIQFSKKEIKEVVPKANQQASNEKPPEKQNGSPAMTTHPAVSEIKQRKNTPTQEKKELSQPSMTTVHIQQRLSELGYQSGPVDGKIGKKTIGALKKFQQDNNLPVTGNADNETVSKLLEKTPKGQTEPQLSQPKPIVKAPQESKSVKAKSPLDF